MNLTIASVSDQVKPWKSQQGGDMVSIYLTFEGGKRGTVNAKADNKDKRIAEMKALIGQAGEFEVDEGDGKFPMKVKSWPGKVAFGAGGGGGGSKWQPKSIEERNEIIAQSCLNAAVALTTAMLGPEGGSRDRTWDWIKQSALDLQSEMFANTIRLARQGSETVPSSRGAVSPDTVANPAVSDHRSEGGGVGPVSGKDTVTSESPPPSEPMTVAEGIAVMNQHTADNIAALQDHIPTHDDILIDNKQMARIHAIAAELGWDHDALKRNVKGLKDGRSLPTYTWAEGQRLIDVLNERLDRERGLA